MGGICGVIAEYDPFHNGHAYHLAETRKRTHADFLIVLMSGYVSQRGSFSLFSPVDKARMALMNGADVVLSMPCTLTVRDAEHYALNAVTVLNRLGMVDSLSFGSELDDLEGLLEIASALESARVQERIGTLIRQGSSYPRAVQCALKEEGLPCASFIGLPNVILAVSYLRCLLKTASSISPVLVQRGGDYHAEKVDFSAPAAGALRRAFLSGNRDALEAGVPENVAALLGTIEDRRRYCDPSLADAILFDRLGRLSPSALCQVPGVSEGIENRILHKARGLYGRDPLLDACCTTRFTKARINRILCHLMLGTTASDLEGPVYLRILGFRRGASGLLKTIRERIPCYQEFKLLEDAPSTAPEVRAAKVWAAASRQPLSSLYADKPVIVS